MGDGIWWLLVPGFVCCAVAMYCAYQILATWILLQSLPIHDIHRLLSDDFSWTWRQLLETLLTLGIAFTSIYWPAGQYVRRYFEPSEALFQYVYTKQAAAAAAAEATAAMREL